MFNGKHTAQPKVTHGQVCNFGWIDLPVILNLTLQSLQSRLGGSPARKILCRPKTLSAPCSASSLAVLARYGRHGARDARLSTAEAGLAVTLLRRSPRPRPPARHSVAPEPSPPREAPLPHLRFVWCFDNCTWRARPAPLYLACLLLTNNRLFCWPVAAVDKTKGAAAAEEAELEGMPPEFYDEVWAISWLVC